MADEPALLSDRPDPRRTGEGRPDPSGPEQSLAITKGIPTNKMLEDQNESWSVLVKVAFAIVVLLILYGFFVWVSLEPMEKRGQFGDMFGGANALISGMAFAALIYATHLQRRELELQRAELKLTREEISKQAVQMTQQTSTFDHQQFDSTFFQLLQLHASILAGIDLGDVGSSRRSGRAAFNQFRVDLELSLPQYRTQGMDRRIAAQEAYAEINSIGKKSLGHYFRNLYHIVKFVDSSRRTEDEKKQYTSFLRAQLSEDEMIVLFFNAQLPRAKKFQPLIEKYALLEHLPIWKFDGADLKLYSEEAYGDNNELLERRRYM
jgi:hypothetical protein